MVHNETLGEYRLTNLKICQSIAPITKCDDTLLSWKRAINKCKNAVEESQISSSVDEMRFWANECLRSHHPHSPMENSSQLTLGKFY